MIFAYGKDQRVLVLNPFDEIDRPKVAYTVPEILEPAQFKRLLETAEEEVPELIPFLAMAGFAGVRRSELIREYAEDQVLKWEDISAFVFGLMLPAHGAGCMDGADKASEDVAHGAVGAAVRRSCSGFVRIAVARIEWCAILGRWRNSRSLKISDWMSVPSSFANIHSKSTSKARREASRPALVRCHGSQRRA